MVHTSLDGAGMFPDFGIFADLANVVVYAAEGDVVGMGTAALSAIPGVGQGVTVAKYGKKGMDAAEAAGKALSKKEGKEAAEAAAKDAPTPGGGGKGGPPKKKTDEPEPEEPKKPKEGDGKDGGYVEGGGKSTPDDEYPDGLAYRSDLPEHLSGPHGFKKNGSLHGTHNQENAIKSISDKGGTYEIKPTSTEGISEMNYKYFNENKGKYVSGSKTVYDPKIHSDTDMLNMSQNAGKKAFESYKNNAATTSYDINEGGVNFRAYINVDKSTGSPCVGNVHPIK